MQVGDLHLPKTISSYSRRKTEEQTVNLNWVNISLQFM